MTRRLLILAMLSFACACARLPKETAHKGIDTAQWRVVLRWQTETEENAFGYFVFRADAPDGEMRCINSDNPVHAMGTTDIPQRYVYFDLDVAPNRTYYYRLQNRNLDGTSEYIVGVEAPVAGKSKPLGDAEREEIRTKGVSYREEAVRQ